MLRKIRSLVSNSDYFGIYDNALSKKECDFLIDYFELVSYIGTVLPNRTVNSFQFL